MRILSDEVPAKLDHRIVCAVFCADVVWFNAAAEFGKHGSDAQSRRGGSKNGVSFKGHEILCTCRLCNHGFCYGLRTIAAQGEELRKRRCGADLYRKFFNVFYRQIIALGSNRLRVK